MNTDIIEYKLIVEGDPAAFQDRVNEYLRRGFTLWGGPELGGPFSQAMVLRDDEELEKVNHRPKTLIEED